MASYVEEFNRLCGDSTWRIDTYKRKNAAVVVCIGMKVK